MCIQYLMLSCTKESMTVYRSRLYSEITAAETIISFWRFSG